MQRSSAEGIFLGRDRQLSDFDRFFETFLSTIHPAPRPQIILISGQGGIGKTTLLRMFRDRLGPEGPFRPALLDIDWHEEQKQAPHRFPSVAEQVSAQAVFSALDRRAVSFPAWPKARKAYEEEQERIAKVKAKMEKALASSQAVRTSTTATDVAAKTAAEAASWAGVPFAKPLVEALVKLGVEIAPQLVESIRTKLGPADVDLIEDFEQHLARGLGRSLAALANSVASRRLLVFFDTYEIVDERDPLVREVICSAGPQVGWVIAGRRDLYADRAQTPRGRFDGYVVGEGHDWDLRPIDVKALAREEIRTFFRQAAPERPVLTDEDLERIHRATGAIPLAIRLAAEIWERVGEVEQIVAGENAPQERIVEEMVGRYEQHCVGQDLHRTALAAIAMAEGDARLLDALLLPEPGIGNQERALRDLLALVNHRYTSVMKESVTELRLHDEPARFYREKMRGHRYEGWVRTLNERAVAHLLSRLKEPWSYHGSLEDLCADNDFLLGAVRLTNHLFWLEEAEAWPWFTVRFVEAMGFSSELREGLLDVAESWRLDLNGIGKKRLQVLRDAEDRPWIADPLQARRRLLEDDERRGWLAETRLGLDRFAAERRVIRLGSAAEAFSQEGRLDDALSALRQAEPDVPLGEFARRLADLGLLLGYKFFERLGRKGDRSVLEACELAVRLDPSSARTHLNLGHAYTWLKAYDKAIEHHRKAIELNPQDGGAWRELGSDYSFLKDYDKAIEHYRKAIELNPQDGGAWRDLGTVYGRLKDYDKAIEHHRKAIELNPQDGGARRELGSDYSLLKDYDKAIEHHRKAIELNPQDGYAWRELGSDYSFLKDYDKAIEHHRKAIELNPQDGGAWRELGSDYSFLKDYDKAIEHHRKAIELNPQDGYAWRDLGNDYTWLNDYEKAIEHHRKAIELNPQDGYAWRELGSDYSFLNDYKEAIEHHRKAIELNPQDPDAWRGLGNDYSGLNDHEKAIEHHRKAVELNPQDDHAWRELGCDFILLSLYQEAFDPIRRARELAENAGAWAWSGYLAMLLGNLQEAFSAFQRAGELDRQIGWPLRAWACGLYRNRDWQVALSKAREAEILEPEKPPLTRLALQRLVSGSLDYDHEAVAENVARERSTLADAQWLALQGKYDDALTKLGEEIAHTPDSAVWARFLPAFHEVRSDPRFITMTRDVPGASWTDFPLQE